MPAGRSRAHSRRRSAIGGATPVTGVVSGFFANVMNDTRRKCISSGSLECEAGNIVDNPDQLDSFGIDQDNRLRLKYVNADVLPDRTFEGNVNTTHISDSDARTTVRLNIALGGASVQ